MRDLRTQGSVALADSASPSFRAAKAEGTLGPNAGNLPHNVQSTSAATNYGAWPAPPPGTGHPYPDMPAVSDARPLLDQMGATGVAIFSGIITSEEYNPDFYWRDGVKIFDQMLRSDGQIGAMREQMEMPLRHADWNIEPASDSDIDKEIASFVESCLFKEMVYETSEGRTLTQTWDDILRHMELSWWYGFSAFEVCWRIEDGWVKWGRWLPLLPRTVWRWWVGEDNELVGIQQWTFKNYTYQFVEIPADKLLLFIHRQEGNNYEGLSLLRSAYKHWWYKSNFEKIEAIGIERNAVVPAVIYLPENFTTNDLSYAQTVVQNIRANELGGITLPARSTGWDLEYPKNQQRYAMQAQPSIQYHDVMMARSVLAQFLNLGSTETGAYALADSQLDSFRASLQGKAKYFEDVINNVAIRRLVDYNYDGVAVYPRIKCSKIALQDLNRLSTLLQALQPYLPPSPELTDWLTKAVGLPVAPSSPIQTTNPTSPSNPDRPQNQNANNHETEESDTKDGTDVAETPPSEGSGSAGGGQSGGDAAVSSGGSARSGLGEPGSEAWLLREAVDAAFAHDAVQRGLDYAVRTVEVIHHVAVAEPQMTAFTLSGHPPGYQQNRNARGQWAPGDGGASRGQTGGSGRSRRGQQPARTRQQSGQSSSSSAQRELARAQAHHARVQRYVEQTRQRAVRAATAARAARQREQEAPDKARAALRKEALAQAKREGTPEHREYQQALREQRAAQREADRTRPAVDEQMRELTRVGEETRAMGYNQDRPGFDPHVHPEYQQTWDNFMRASNTWGRALDRKEAADHAVKTAEDRIVYDHANDQAVASHPLVARAHEAMVAAEAKHQAAVDAHAEARQYEHEANARVMRAQGLIAVAAGGKGVQVTYGTEVYTDEAITKAAIENVFGHPVSEADLVALSGAQIGDAITVNGGSMFGLAPQTEFSVSVEGGNIERNFEVTRAGNNVILQDHYTGNTGTKSASSGADIIRGMENMQRVGVTRVVCSASRGNSMNGYYTWARLGFTGRIPTGMMGAHVVSEMQTKFGNVTRVEQLMQKPGGPQWWKRNGQSWEASFSFRNAYSMRTLAHYKHIVERHGGGAGDDTSEGE